MPIQSAEELLLHELHDIQDAEKQASQALKRMMKQAEDDQLRTMLERRLQEGERVLQAVQTGIERLNGKSRGTRNEAARGLIEEAEKLLKEVTAPEMKQAVMIAGTQKLEHYCIAAWGTVKAIASGVGEQELVDAMQQALDEGYAWDREMTELAESRVNPEAMMAEEEMEEGEDEMEEGEGGQGRSRQQSGRKTQSAKGGSGSGSGGKRGDQGGGKSQSARSGASAAKKSSGGKQGGGKSSQSARGGSKAGGGGQESSDLKSREYRDEDGNVHHHTREYMERQGK